MKTISRWQDLEDFGIVFLTGESCGLSYRYLFDLTMKGKSVVEKTLGVGHLTLFDAWNRGSDVAPHVGSILLPPEMLVPLSVFGLLETGSKECWVAPDRLAVYAPEDGDDVAEILALLCRSLGVEGLRRYAYRGTDGDRNRHGMSGRGT